MTTAGTILTNAYREGNLVPVGKQPTAAELVEGLSLLNAVILSAFSFYIGQRLVDWSVPQQQNTGGTIRDFPLQPGANVPLTPTFPNSLPPNTRLVWGGAEQYIYFPPMPEDGACIGLVAASGAALNPSTGTLTLDGNGRTIGGENTVLFADLGVVPPGLRWFYRADIANWMQIQPMAAGDECLFPMELDDYWVCATAVRLAPRYGKVLSPATVARLKEMNTVMLTRYATKQVTGSGLTNIRPTYQSFNGPADWSKGGVVS